MGIQLFKHSYENTCAQAFLFNVHADYLDHADHLGPQYLSTI
jgi:hypothetical protein